MYSSKKILSLCAICVLITFVSGGSCSEQVGAAIEVQDTRMHSSVESPKNQQMPISALVDTEQKNSAEKQLTCSCAKSSEETVQYVKDSKVDTSVEKSASNKDGASAATLVADDKTNVEVIPSDASHEKIPEGVSKTEPSVTQDEVNSAEKENESEVEVELENSEKGKETVKNSSKSKFNKKDSNKKKESYKSKQEKKNRKKRDLKGLAQDMGINMKGPKQGKANKLRGAKGGPRGGRGANREQVVASREQFAAERESNSGFRLI